MKKIISLTLSLLLLLSICGCKKASGNGSSYLSINDNEIIEYSEVVYIDKDGNEIVSNASNADDSPSNSSEQVDSKTDTTGSKIQDSEVVIDYDTVVEVDICDPIIRAYLDATTAKQQYAMLSQYSEKLLDYQVLPLEWQVDGSHTYTIYLSENADFSNSTKLTVGKPNQSDKNTICVPGKTYYWKVLGIYSDKPLGGGKIKIKDAPVRWVKIDGVHNVRDMGGWKTESGKTVKYEMIYRGAGLEKITNRGIETIKQLGLKTEIDVRSTASWDSHGAVDGTGLDYYFLDSNYPYENILFSGANSKVAENMQQLFTLLSDESNYPILLHCGGGTDRTGTYAFILNGLLGVSYEDLTRDYELTSYAGADRWRGNGNGETFEPDDLIHENVSNSQEDASWGVLNKKFMESEYCTDGKLSTAIENFLLDRGVTKSQIDAYKNIMLK